LIRVFFFFFLVFSFFFFLWFFWGLHEYEMQRPGFLLVFFFLIEVCFCGRRTPSDSWRQPLLEILAPLFRLNLFLPSDTHLPLQKIRRSGTSIPFSICSPPKPYRVLLWKAAESPPKYRGNDSSFNPFSLVVVVFLSLRSRRTYLFLWRRTVLPSFSLAESSPLRFCHFI